MAYTDLNQIKKHKIFISYHHANDGRYKEALLNLNDEWRGQIFDDRSVDTGGIDESLDAESIRTTIRDDYLSDSTVTIVLIGIETKHRKHIDWELHSSMYDGEKNKKSGIILMVLPSVGEYSSVPYEEIKAYYDNVTWTSVSDAEFRRRHSYLSEKMILNVRNKYVSIPVVPWGMFGRNPIALKHLIDVTFQNKDNCKYDLSMPMMGRNS